MFVFVSRDFGCCVRRFALKVAKLGDVGELKAQICRLVNVKADNLQIAEVYRHRFHRFLDDRQPIAYMSEHDTVHAFESTANIQRIVAQAAKRLSNPNADPDPKPQASQAGAAADTAGVAAAAAATAAATVSAETDGYY